ncbi:CHASE domain-containing protein [Maritalea mediterranea]|uniref:histidine kinase n=1 Tax=Maritalea mediterranea TaxID=2909667 RepID=A0ABS9E3D0_9HYPH|nr:CHASE domain-containing protein [Maritalea mediterranea]MCF4097362.1 CHASE domain-containing protein [Maritalea mediterranea]
MKKPGWLEFLFKTLAVASVYGLLGKFGTMLALPESHATLIWLPSGLALMAVLHWGNRMAPAIVLGSVLVNFEPTAGQIAANFESLTGYILIGCGAALQALVGGWAVRRFVGFPNPLNDERNILLFLLWGGAISCLLNPIWASAVLLQSNKLLPDEYLMNVIIWWAGDAAGVAVAAPILAVWSQRKNGNWRRRALTVSGSILTAFALTILVVAMSVNWQRHRMQLEFQSVADLAGTAISEAFTNHTRILDYFEGFAATKTDITSEAFSNFSQRFLDNSQGLTALTWMRYLRADERAAFEAKMRAEGFDNFMIVEPGPDGKMIPAANRADHAVVQYVEPFEPNKIGLGFDAGFNPVRRAAFERAIDTGEMVATQRIILILENENQYGALATMPIYHGGEVPETVEGRREKIKGFMVAVFRVGDIAQTAISEFNGSPFILSMKDLSAPEAEQFLYANRSEAEGVRWLDDNGPFGQKIDMTQSYPIEFGTRRWVAEIVPSREFLARAWQYQNSFIIMFAGLLFTTIVGIFVLVLSGRHERLNQLVDARTSELEQSRRRLQQAQKIARIGSWEYDLSGEKIWCSSEVLDILDLEDIPTGHGLDFTVDLVPENERKMVQQNLRLEKLKEGPISFSHTVNCREGREKDILQHVEVLSEQGRPATVIGTLQDITEMRQLDRLKTEFVATVSHELRTPLTSIKGAIGILHGGVIADLPRQAQELASIANANCNRLIHLVDDLLDINGIMSGNLVLHPKKVDLETLIQQSVALNAAYADQHRTTLAIEYCEPRLSLNVDEGRLMQVITNLISNASKFSADPGEVRIRVEKLEGVAKISIQDNGNGIPEAFRSKIFSRFSQADSSTTRAQSGAGLGLYISKELVDAMKGEIGFHSNDNEGTTFYVTLPLEETA